VVGTFSWFRMISSLSADETKTNLLAFTSILQNKNEDNSNPSKGSSDRAPSATSTDCGDQEAQLE